MRKVRSQLKPAQIQMFFILNALYARLLASLILNRHIFSIFPFHWPFSHSKDQLNQPVFPRPSEKQIWIRSFANIVFALTKTLIDCHTGRSFIEICFLSLHFSTLFFSLVKFWFLFKIKCAGMKAWLDHLYITFFMKMTR